MESTTEVKEQEQAAAAAEEEERVVVVVVESASTAGRRCRKTKPLNPTRVQHNRGINLLPRTKKEQNQVQNSAGAVAAGAALALGRAIIAGASTDQQHEGDGKKQ